MLTDDGTLTSHSDERLCAHLLEGGLVDAEPLERARRLAGAGGEGTLTFDETLWTDIGSQTLDPISGLLSFDATVGGVAFAITDDVAFPLFPSVTLTDGIISAISYVGATLAGDVLNVAGRGFEFIGAVAHGAPPRPRLILQPAQCPAPSRTGGGFLLSAISRRGAGWSPTVRRRPIAPGCAGPPARRRQH